MSQETLELGHSVIVIRNVTREQAARDGAGHVEMIEPHPPLFSWDGHKRKNPTAVSGREGSVNNGNITALGVSPADMVELASISHSLKSQYSNLSNGEQSEAEATELKRKPSLFSGTTIRGPANAPHSYLRLLQFVAFPLAYQHAWTRVPVMMVSAWTDHDLHPHAVVSDHLVHYSGLKSTKIIPNILQWYVQNRLFCKKNVFFAIHVQSERACFCCFIAIRPIGVQGNFTVALLAPNAVRRGQLTMVCGNAFRSLAHGARSEERETQLSSTCCQLS